MPIKPGAYAELRGRTGMLRDVARALGCAPITIRRQEAGHREITLRDEYAMRWLAAHPELMAPPAAPTVPRPIELWLAASTQKVPGSWVSSAGMWASWLDWCKAHDHWKGSRKDLALTLQRLGYRPHRIGPRGSRGYEGVALGGAAQVVQRVRTPYLDDLTEDDEM